MNRVRARQRTRINSTVVSRPVGERKSLAATRTQPKRSKLSDEQILLGIHLKELGYGCQFEFRFDPDRKWRFDAAILTRFGPKVAIEIDGGAWTRGRHTRGAGYIADMEKLNRAARLGWKVYRFTPEQVRTGYAKEFLREALG